MLSHKKAEGFLLRLKIIWFFNCSSFSCRLHLSSPSLSADKLKKCKFYRSLPLWKIVAHSLRGSDCSDAGNVPVCCIFSFQGSQRSLVLPSVFDCWKKLQKLTPLLKKINCPVYLVWKLDKQGKKRAYYVIKHSRLKKIMRLCSVWCTDGVNWCKLLV